MSAQPVGVLAVLRAEQRRAGREGAARFENAIAAVSALIEATRGVKFDVYALTTPELQEVFDGQRRIAVVRMDTVAPMRAALARCGGTS